MRYTISENRMVKFVTAMTAPRIVAFKDCCEAGMDYETALGCCGLKNQPALLAYHDFIDRNNGGGG